MQLTSLHLDLFAQLAIKIENWGYADDKSKSMTDNIMRYLNNRWDSEMFTDPEEVNLYRALKDIEGREMIKDIQDSIDEMMGNNAPAIHIQPAQEEIKRLRKFYKDHEKELRGIALKLALDDDIDPAGGHGLHSHV